MRLLSGGSKIIKPQVVAPTSNGQVKDRTFFLRHLRNVDERCFPRTLALGGIAFNVGILASVEFEGSAIEQFDLKASLGVVSFELFDGLLPRHAFNLQSGEEWLKPEPHPRLHLVGFFALVTADAALDDVAYGFLVDGAAEYASIDLGLWREQVETEGFPLLWWLPRAAKAFSHTSD